MLTFQKKIMNVQKTFFYFRGSFVESLLNNHYTLANSSLKISNSVILSMFGMKMKLEVHENKNCNPMLIYNLVILQI